MPVTDVEPQVCTQKGSWLSLDSWLICEQEMEVEHMNCDQPGDVNRLKCGNRDGKLGTNISNLG